MTGKIFRGCFAAGLAGMILCVALFMGITANRYEREIWQQMEQEAEYIARGLETAGGVYLEGLTSAQRLTWVDPNGTVRYDSMADPQVMDNHLNREEITQALQEGQGTSEHFSSTMLQKTLYYATRLEDGTVLRVSCNRGTVGAMLLGAVQPVLWIVVLALVLSGLLASRVARQITRPINTIDLEQPRLDETYEELFPLVCRLREQNVTIGRQMEQLRRHQQEFAALSENMNEGVLLIDTKHTVLSGNQSAFSFLHTDGPVEVLGLDCCPKELWDAANQALAGQRSEVIFREEDRSLELLANPVTASGHVIGAVLLIVDVTEREERESLRREFSATVSHELKTPLTAISGFAELMKEGLVAPDKTKEFAGDIYKECRRLIDLVDDILKLSRLDEGAPGFEEDEVDLYALAQDHLARLKPVAEERGISLTLEGGPQTITGVQHLLSEMLYNLCDNAIKYNETGGSVTVRVTGTPETVTLAVSDTGIGISPGQQNRVFERFYRGDKNRPMGGTGLGLSIVKHGAKYHNAKLSLDSEPGVGTTITLEFQRRTI